MKIIPTLLTLLLASLSVFSQVDSTGGVSLSGFVDAYYAYDFNRPPAHERPAFLYNHSRHNEFSINLAFLKAAYASENVRGNVALMAGSYAQYNLAAEQELLRHVLEANAGVRLGRGLWLDAGILPSHIGLESAVSKDNLTLTRSLAAENSPYYESGVKLTWETGKWVLSALALNGWQNIRETEGNSGKAVGSQVQFRPTGKVLLNSSTFIGNEKADSARQMRFFHDLYATFLVLPRVKVAAVFDLGAEKRLGSEGFAVWHSAALLLHYGLSSRVALAARAEYYSDRAGVIIPTGSPHGFRTAGYSLGLDYAPAAKALLRVEGRLLDSRDGVFLRGTRPVRQSAAITSSLAVCF
ncbi:porin [Rufibacter tibetensis]|uniref:Porin n=1 Tax=Rufibacter tibetensis TaxID=512763 RepID=A0A0P0C8V2_9BACT|nr:porin [Rufibacter tibetensis]ALJ01716.1 hypothetical protein DC20_21965 [Rufibacter tibetensis]